MNLKGQKIAISGAGLVGCLFAALMRKQGASVTVYEKREDMRSASVYGGRSINLALSDRGIRSLDLLGITDKVLNQSIPMKGRMVHSEDGALNFQPYSSEGKFINSVSRSELNKTLMNTAEELGVEFIFNATIKLKKKKFVHSNDEKIEADLYIGADGAFSKIRKKIDSEAFIQPLTHSYKELHINPRDREFAMEPNALHIWPRQTYLLIALPNADKSFTATLILPKSGENSFDELQSISDAKLFFESHFKDSLNVIEEFDKQYEVNPISELGTVRSETWSNGENILLIGDAAHGIIPFYGQGMNAGFEDCYILNELVESCTSWKEVLKKYCASRPKDTDAIAQLSINNFIEMRDKVADPHFILQKKIERKLHERFPDQWIQLYTMVTFSHISYSTALNRGIYQNNIMQSVLQIDNIEEKVDQDNLDDVISLLKENGALK